jgi:hypothetical protein
MESAATSSRAAGSSSAQPLRALPPEPSVLRVRDVMQEVIGAGDAHDREHLLGVAFPEFAKGGGGEMQPAGSCAEVGAVTMNRVTNATTSPSRLVIAHRVEVGLLRGKYRISSATSAPPSGAPANRI